MAYKRIDPKSVRSQMHLQGIQEKYDRARAAVDAYGIISPQEMGIDWNWCTVGNGRQNALSFSLKPEYNTNGKTLDGIVKEFGNGERRIYITGGTGDVGGSEFPNRYVFESVAEAVDIASKIEIVENVILPPGAALIPLHPGSGAGGGGTTGPAGIDEYRAFAAELLAGSKKIIVSKPVNQDFGDYIVAQTQQGCFIAYNKHYGEGLYIVDDFDTLLHDKSTIRKKNEALRVRRDRRGNWRDRVRAFM